MNEQQLAKIENRWAACSGGPWIVENWTKPEHERCHVAVPQYVLDEFRDTVNGGKDSVLKPILIRTFQDAAQANLMSDREEWIRKLEEEQFAVSYDRIAQACRLVLPCTRAKRTREEREEDKKFFRNQDGPAVTRPIFAILGPEQTGECRPPDLEFVLHAPEDMGVLIEEVKRQEEVIGSLKAQLLEAREALRIERERSAQVNASVAGDARDGQEAAGPTGWPGMSARLDRPCASCGRPRGACGSPACVTHASCHPVPSDPDPDPTHTESNGPETEQVSPVVSSIGTIPLRDYLAMVAPGAILIQKREVSWMLFVVFLAGSIVGSLLHRLLA